MKYVIKIYQAPGREGILAKKGKTIIFPTKGEAKKFGQQNAKKVFMLTSWEVIGYATAKRQGFPVN